MGACEAEDGGGADVQALEIGDGGAAEVDGLPITTSIVVPIPVPGLNAECVGAGATVIGAADGGALVVPVVGAATTTELNASPVEFNGVVTALAVDVVVAATTDEDIVALAAMEGVDAGLAFQAIVAATALEEIVAGFSKEGVIASEAAEDVVAVSAGEPVWIGCAEEGLRAGFCADAVEGVGVPVGGGEIKRTFSGDPQPAPVCGRPVPRQLTDGEGEELIAPGGILRATDRGEGLELIEGEAAAVL